MSITPFYWKLIAGGVLAALLGIGVSSWLAQGAKIDRLEETQLTMLQAVTQATVEPGKDGKRKLLSPDRVPAAIAGLKSSYDSAASTLAGIDKIALAEKALQTKLDSQLSAILAGQDKAAESTRSRITDLLNRQATGDREKDCAVMDDDSNAAWDGWRK